MSEEYKPNILKFEPHEIYSIYLYMLRSKNEGFLSYKKRKKHIVSMDKLGLSIKNITMVNPNITRCPDLECEFADGRKLIVDLAVAANMLQEKI